MTPLGKELKRILIQKDLKWSDLAARIGISGAYISMVHRGFKSPSPRFINLIIEKLELDLDQASTLRELGAAERDKSLFNHDPTIFMEDEDRKLVLEIIRNINRFRDELKLMVRS